MEVIDILADVIEMELLISEIIVRTHQNGLSSRRYSNQE